MPSLPDFETISSDFAFLDDWDERYRYLIDLGKQLPEFPEDLKTEETRVRGCASQVWLAFDQREVAITSQVIAMPPSFGD